MDSPVFGCGGIEKWHDAAEYFAVGAWRLKFVRL